MESTLRFKRTFFPPGVRAEYTLELHSPTPFLPLLVDAALREIIAPLILNKKSISNLKGRDRVNVLNAGLAPRYQPSGDEFFYVAGEIVSSPRASGGQEFSVAINSTFLPSEVSEMLHAPELIWRGLPKEVPLMKLGRIIPVRINKFRLGFDVFHQRRVSSLMGAVPTVTQTILLEADQHRCDISIVAEDLKSRTQEILKRDELFARISRSIEAAFGLNIQQDYESKARS